MKRRQWIIGMAGLVSLLSPVVAGAATFRGGEQEEIVIDAPVLDDLYAAGNRVVVKEDVAQDAMLAGQAVSTSSVIGGDVYAAGQFVRLEGVIEDDAHLAGNTIEIEGRVEGDVLAAGQSIMISESAVITGDVLAAGQSVMIAGDVQGSVKVAGDSLRVESGAVIGGEVVMYGNAPTIAEGAQVRGEVRHVQPQQKEASTGSVLLLSWVRGVLAVFVVAMVVVWLLPAVSKQALVVARTKPALAFFTGFGWMVLVVPLAVLLVFSLIGIPLAVALLLTTGLFLIAGSGVAALLIGHMLLKRLDKKHETREEQTWWPQALLGAAVYKTVQLLGPPGWVVGCLILLWAMGALAQAVWKSRIKN